MQISEHLFFYRGIEKLFPAFGMYSGNTSIIRGDGLTLIDPGTSPGFQLRSVRETAARETESDPRISLIKLGKILIGNSYDVPAYEIIPMAHTVLKSIGFKGESPLLFDGII